MKMTTVPTFLNFNQVSERFGVSIKTLRRMMDAGDFPRPVRVGKSRIAWPEQQLVEWIASRAT